MMYLSANQETIRQNSKWVNFHVHDMQLFGSAATAKLIATTLTYPHEVVRTRMRERTEGKEYATLISSFKNLYKQNGFRGLYAGYEAHVLRTVPNAAIMFMIVELILHNSLQIVVC